MTSDLNDIINFNSDFTIDVLANCSIVMGAMSGSGLVTSTHKQYGPSDTRTSELTYSVRLTLPTGQSLPEVADTILIDGDSFKITAIESGFNKRIHLSVIQSTTVNIGKKGMLK
jgi:hypothetical protein